MKNLRKKLIVLLLTMFIPFIVNASSASVSIKCNNVVSAGETVKCTISMNNSGDIIGLQANYDFGGLSYVKLTPTSGVFDTPNMTENGFTLGNNGGLASSLTVGILEVKVPSNASENQKFTLTLKNVIVSNSEYEDVDVANASATLRVASNNAALKSLSLSDITLDPTFSATTMIYNVSTEVAKTTISATSSDSNAKVSGTGEKTLKYGNNSFNVVVTSEAGTKKTYTININRIDNRETDNNLKSLSVEGQTITPEFKSSIKEYTVNVNSDVETAKINCEVSGSKATFVEKYGPRTIKLKYGRNEVQIQVKAENGKVNTYKLIINRKDDRDSNNYLSSLEVSEGTINFNKDTTSYTINVSKDITKIDIKATPESEKAKVTGIGSKTLKDGNNSFVIEVKAENEKVKKYTLTIIKSTEDEQVEVVETFINTLNIKNADFEFDSITESYDLELKEGDKLEIEYELPEGITAEVIGNENLNNGGSVQLVLTALNGQSKTYTFNVKEKQKIIEAEVKEETPKKEETKFPWWIIAVVVVVVFLVIAYIIGKKKKDDDNNNLNGGMPSSNNNVSNEQSTSIGTNNVQNNMYASPLTNDSAINGQQTTIGTNIAQNNPYVSPLSENVTNSTQVSENIENNQNQLY